MNRSRHRPLIGSSVLLGAVALGGAGLAAWKHQAILSASPGSVNEHEPAESVTVAVARAHEHRPATTSIGTVLALRSVTLRNELPGTVAHVALTPGQIVEPGTLLVALDVSVEQAELEAHEAQARLAQIHFDRVARLGPSGAASPDEVDTARTSLDVARAQVQRVKALIARKTIRAPFRARVGIADVHVGQYLEEGTVLTTLQGVDEAVHVDFTVAQRVAEQLREGDVVEVFAGQTDDSRRALPARVVAVDARVDPLTRNATVRARLEDAGGVPPAPPPGASVRVRVPMGEPQTVVAVPVSALRKGPAGDHVFVVSSGAADGMPRAALRRVRSGPILGEEVLIHAGLEPGERVAASGSFKLRDNALVAVAHDPASRAPEQAAASAASAMPALH